MNVIVFGELKVNTWECFNSDIVSVPQGVELMFLGFIDLCLGVLLVGKGFLLFEHCRGNVIIILYGLKC